VTPPASFLVDEADAPALRRAVSNIARTGYSEKAVRERLGLEDLSALRWRALPAYREERLAARDPLALAIELFLLQGSLPPNEADRLFAASDLEFLVRIGLLAIDGAGRARACASLFPVGDQLVFSDPAWPELSHPGLSAVPYNQVMFVGADSRQLARCTLRRRVRSTLDLCTGSGVQALLAAAHSERVVAVDINPRAVDCARFNAQALGVSNLEVRVGDLFAPVDGERFDLITANPPFVPSPVDEIRFRDGGRSGEDIQKRIVAGLPCRLAPGGTAQMVTELGERDEELLLIRLREWLAGAPMDIHVLRLHDYPAIDYAIGHAKGESYDEYLDSVDAWAGNLRAQGFVRVVSLLVSFEWSDPACGPPWQRMEESQPPKRTAGAEIEADFLAERMIRRPDFAQNLEQFRLGLAGPVALLDARVLGSDLPAHAKATRLGQALTIEHPLDPVEREILLSIERPIDASELLTVLGKLGIGRESVVTAVTSLLRKRLACLDGGNPGPPAVHSTAERR
jgi:SAM-dependent methyltransferase